MDDLTKRERSMYSEHPFPTEKYKMDCGDIRGNHKKSYLKNAAILDAGRDTDSVLRRRLLVLGARGFIGRRFVELFGGNYDIILFEDKINEQYKDLTAYKEIYEILKQYRPDTILNLAGKLYQKDQNSARIYESNLSIQLNIHEAVNHLNLNSRIVFCSSGAVYHSAREPVDENSECLPLNIYAKAKYIQEKIALSYHPKHRVVIARVFNVIGPNQNKNFFVPGIIDRVLRYKKKEISTVKLKTLNAMRDYIYIDDVCNAINLLINKGVSGEIYNVCRGEGIYIKQVIETLKEILDISELPVAVEEDYVKEGINYQVGSCEKIRKLGWAPSFCLKDSLKEIIREKHEN